MEYRILKTDNNWQLQELQKEGYYGENTWVTCGVYYKLKDIEKAMKLLEND